jgi:hypothetical protein
MTEAVDVLHAIERLVALARAGPGANEQALKEANAVLFRMGLGNGTSGYKAEKLGLVRDDLKAWLSEGQWTDSEDDLQMARGRLLADIEHLRKALARGSGGQD